MQPVSSSMQPFLAMDLSTAMNFKVAATLFFVAFFIVVFGRIATRDEAFYNHDATTFLNDNVTKPQEGVNHE
ncbi:MAG: hypothetical protein P1V35_10990 [Planctomycetota bacterium]|nr:hypothetical protein [Planctomycetota bacterium]